jgi:hypothetical protein
MCNLIGKEKYFIHRGTWKNDYEWRIQKVKITGIRINEDGEEFVEFSFACTAYEYPASDLCNTLEEAKKKAIEMIDNEAYRLKELIKATPTEKGEI